MAPDINEVGTDTMNKVRELGLNLTPGEVAQLGENIGREPTVTELFLFDVMWSEHCSYKSSRALLKKYLPTRSERAPEKALSRLEVDSASPSISPMVAVRAPRTLARKRGRTFSTISLETSVRKLVRLAAQTLRGTADRRRLAPGWGRFMARGG